jgi:hypothetical protein
MEALDLLDKSLTKFKERRGRDCLPGTAHKIYFLWEIGLDHYFRGDITIYEARLSEAEALLGVVQGYANFQRTHDLIHNEANLALLKGFRSAPNPRQRVGYYRTAAERLLWCLWNGAHIGARLRLALLHAIGTPDYSQALAYLNWIDRALLTRGYGQQLPFVVRLRAIRSQLATMAAKGVILGDSVLLLQATSDAVPHLSSAVVEGESIIEAEESRRRIFDELSVAWRPIPVSRALGIPL